MPYKDPLKQKEFQQRWAAENSEKMRGYYRKFEETEKTKEYRKVYRQSKNGKEKAKARREKYFAAHGGYTEATKNYPSRSPREQRNRYYKFTHGITITEFEAQVQKQNNLCPIGNHPFGSRGKQGDSPCQDHDHESGENRLILCRNHNVALGLFNDSIEDMQAAILYLDSFKKTTGELQCPTPQQFVGKSQELSN